MMLVNVLVPVLEHGLRPDWKSVLPAATVSSSSARWLQNMAVKARSGRPGVYDMLQVRCHSRRARALLRLQSALAAVVTTHPQWRSGVPRSTRALSTLPQKGHKRLR